MESSFTFFFKREKRRSEIFICLGRIGPYCDAIGRLVIFIKKKKKKKFKSKIIRKLLKRKRKYYVETPIISHVEIVFRQKSFSSHCITQFTSRNLQCKG